MLRVGAVLAGRYEVVGGGGGGWAHQRARDRWLNRPVAVTLLAGPEGGDEEERARAAIRRAARLAHPNLVDMYDSGTHEGVAFLVRQLVEAPSLAEEMDRGPLGDERLRDVGAQLLAALEAIHASGLVHAHLSPQVVLIGADGLVKVAPPPDPIQREGSVVAASPSRYAAPERRHGGPATALGDLWSAAATLHAAAGGALGLDPSIAAVLERGLRSDPQGRFSSASEMAAALKPARRAVDQAATTTAPVPRTGAPATPTPASTNRRQASGRSWTVAWVATVALGVILALRGLDLGVEPAATAGTGGGQAPPALSAPAGGSGVVPATPHGAGDAPAPVPPTWAPAPALGPSPPSSPPSPGESRPGQQAGSSDRSAGKARVGAQEGNGTDQRRHEKGGGDKEDVGGDGDEDEKGDD